MIINHNMNAMNAHRQLGMNTVNAGKSMEKLSSGLRINRAGDDAAGLAISEKMRAQIRGLDQGVRNAQDAISMIQTAEGGLNETHAILQRMRELSVQSANATNTDEDRNALQNEISQLKNEIDRIGNNTEFNTKKLLNGSLSGSASGGEGKSLGNATSASIETGDFNPANFTSGSTTNFQVKLDGHTFNLMGVDSTDSFAFFNDLESKLKTAIDAHNTSNPNDKVEYAKFEIIVTDATNMNFKITSGTTGSKSEISITPLEDNSNTTAQGPTDMQHLLTDGATPTLGSDGKFSKDLTGLTNSSILKMSFNGNAIDVKLADTGTGTYNEGDDIKTLAEKLKTDINDALDQYKTLTGKDFGTVDVTVEDGKIKITSSNSDTVSFEIFNDENGVADKLGLSSVASGNQGGLDFHIGANKGQSINLQINNMTSSGLEIADVDISTKDGANNAITTIDAAIKKVSDERAKLGAVQNRLEHTIANLGTSSENLTAAESRVRDVDMAKEMMSFSKNNILAQAAQAMLAQANQQPQGVLQLLR
ncbi:flagellin [Clostridium sp. USBA 49]|uniref:flagellin N-terminal helical domain-containing protein n=1 Tax=Clostridium sp. USBA 49 TaxID=1881060 RepID=UPI00099ABFB8|nr:flagellin [Clostridium sp. USBA 49]SKA73568.1 flagellin [Clostridium sp. USBA 49]